MEFAFIFDVEDGEVQMPCNLHDCSKFIIDYVKAFDGQMTSEELKAPIRWEVPNAKIRHLNIVFEFIERAKETLPQHYQSFVNGDTNDLKQIKNLPEWAKLYFSKLDRDDVISSLNAANFLQILIFIKFGTLFLILQVQQSASSFDASQYLNIGVMYNKNEPMAFRRHATEFSGNWSQMLDSTVPHVFRPTASSHLSEDFLFLSKRNNDWGTSSRPLRPIGHRNTDDRRFGKQKFSNFGRSPRKNYQSQNNFEQHDKPSFGTKRFDFH